LLSPLVPLVCSLNTCPSDLLQIFDWSISGVNAKKEMMNSRLPNTVLGKIWKLADCDQDGMLDDEEFALAQHLIQVKLEGYELTNYIFYLNQLFWFGFRPPLVPGLGLI
uniref:EH domain-containing protein n=1 Tax=Periophthalmus magnuspinnatus TaxID=409849 RepID=A0A3B4AHM2_9GOBI